MLKHEKYIKEMSVKEKAEAVCTYQGRCMVIECMGNVGMRMGDNPRGNEDYALETPEERQQGYHPVCYPQAAAAAATWDEQVAYIIGKAMGRECKKQDMNVLLRPGVNIKRSPLCGRNFEYYSEDPVLSGKLGAAFIRGVQSGGTAACLKHYAVNSQEFERMTTNAVVSERALREIYLKPFEIAVREGDPWTIMTSYNKVNGQWVPANEKLMRILREEFGYDGVVMSDAMAIHTEKVLSHKCGLDFELSGRGTHAWELQDAVERGNLEEEILDKNIERLLELQEKTGKGKEQIPETQPEEEHKLARKLAVEGVVLLSNDGTLPISRGKKIAVIGRLAKEPNYMGAGSGHMNGWKVDITLDEIRKLAGKDSEILYADGYEIRENTEEEVKIRPELIEEAVETAGKADIVLFFTGLPVGYETEGEDRKNLSLPEDMRKAGEAVLETGKKTVLINVSGAPVDIGAWTEKASAIIHSYLSGEAMGGALTDVLFGEEEPAGRLPETFPERLEDTPSYMSFPNYPAVMPDVYYGEDIFVGYRWYEKRKLPVLYPFGYGLSYTSFTYSDVRMNRENFEDGGNIEISVRVKNTGNRKGAQVIQVYVRKDDSSFICPEKELKGFKKVVLEPGEEREVTVSFAVNELGYYDESKKEWVREDGGWTAFLGISSREIIKALPFYLKGNRAAKVFHSMTPLDWFFRSPVLGEVLEDRADEVKAAFSPDEKLKALICGLPVYRLTEDVFMSGEPLPKEELADIIDKLNHTDKKEQEAGGK